MGKDLQSMPSQNLRTTRHSADYQQRLDEGLAALSEPLRSVSPGLTLTKLDARPLHAGHCSEFRQASKRRRCSECDNSLHPVGSYFAPCGAGPMHWYCRESHYMYCPCLDTSGDESSSGEDVDAIDSFKAAEGSMCMAAGSLGNAAQPLCQRCGLPGLVGFNEIVSARCGARVHRRCLVTHMVACELCTPPQQPTDSGRRNLVAPSPYTSAAWLSSSSAGRFTAGEDDRIHATWAARVRSLQKIFSLDDESSSTGCRPSLDALVKQVPQVAAVDYALSEEEAIAFKSSMLELRKHQALCALRFLGRLFLICCRFMVTGSCEDAGLILDGVYVLLYGLRQSF